LAAVHAERILFGPARVIDRYGPGVVKIILNSESKIDLLSVLRFGILPLMVNTLVIPAGFWRE